MAKRTRLKTPTRAQKIIIANKGFDWRNWYVIKETEAFLFIQNKVSNFKKHVQK